MKAADVQRAGILLQARGDVDDAIRGLHDALGQESKAVGQWPGVAIASGLCNASQNPLPTTGWFQVDHETGRKIIEAAREVIRSELAALGVE